MHPPSRARRILKWTGVGLSLLFVILWMASLMFEISIRLPVYANLEFDGGILFVLVAEVNGPNPLPRSEMRRRETQGVGFNWPGFMRSYMTPEERPAFMMTIMSFPFWLLLLLTAIPTAWLWHRDRRLISSSPGHRLCLRCGYDLTGNTSGVCPECGDKASPPAVLAD